MFGKKECFFINKVLNAGSESIKATTFPSSDPSEKPYYVPANTQCVTDLYQVIKGDNPPQGSVFCVHHASPKGSLGSRW